MGFLFAPDRNLMRMYVILVLCALLIIGLSFLAVYSVKVRQAAGKARKQRAVADRLNAVVARAEQEQHDRKAAAKASAALTVVLPAINQGDRAPRSVT